MYQANTLYTVQNTWLPINIPRTIHSIMYNVVKMRKAGLEILENKLQRTRHVNICSYLRNTTYIYMYTYICIYVCNENTIKNYIQYIYIYIYLPPEPPLIYQSRQVKSPKNKVSQRIASGFSWICFGFCLFYVLWICFCVKYKPGPKKRTAQFMLVSQCFYHARRRTNIESPRSEKIEGSWKRVAKFPQIPKGSKT